MKLKFAAAIATASFAMATPASAAKMLVTFSGAIIYGYDDLGRFAAPGTILTGQSAVARYTIDTGAPTLFPIEDTANHSRIDSGTGYNLPYDQPAVLATLTIAGRTLTIGHYSASAQWSRAGLGNNIFQHLMYFSASNGGNTIVNIALFNTAGAAPSAHITDGYDLSILPSGNASYFGEGINNVNTVARWEVTRVTSAVLGVPEPASWALMIGGFGVVGGAARRRRSAAALG